MFVSFEGIDGSGKSTQTALLAASLRGDGHEIVQTREPGGTALGERVRELVLADGEMAPWAEAALFAAARAQLVSEVVRPALARGATVVSDRYLDSSLAYQGIARGLGIEPVLELNRIATDGLLPDRTFLLLLPPAAALSRARGSDDRIEREGRAFLERVDGAYRELARRFPERVVSLDATLPAAELAGLVRANVRALAWARATLSRPG